MPNPTGSTTQKRPFQDITDRFISPRPKRKPKTPGGALGEKLRLKVIESTHIDKVFPSSLPPSSPPLYHSSSSRGLPLLSSEDEVAQQMHEDEGGVAPFGQEDFGSMLPSDEDGDSDAENRAPANLSDPFGFFAVERKLKAEREIQPATLRGAARYTDDKERDDGLVMPPTPHKPTIGMRALADVVSPTTTSAAFSGTPSPVKGMNTSHELLPVQQADEPEDDGDAPRRKKPRRSSEASLPPRRSTRGQGKTAAEKEVSKPKKQVRKAPAKTKAKATAKGKGKKKVVEDNDLDDDQQEKFEADRQARLEYFRKLDDYSFEKENVYVV